MKKEQIQTGTFVPAGSEGENPVWNRCGNGQWIGAGDAMEKLGRRAPLLRKTFAVTGAVQNARLYICGLGLFDVEINGQKPDDSVLNPANTQYTQTVLYRTFDVTDCLMPGENAIGVELGNGFYNEHTGVWNWEKAAWRDDPKLLVNLEINYEDGSRETIVTDTTWKLWVNGPTVANSIYLGEVYDENLRVDDCSMPGFDDSAWVMAQPVAAPAGRLVCQTLPPVRRLGVYEPLHIEKMSAEGKGTTSDREAVAPVWIITATETLSGWAKIRMKAAKGKTITVTYGEQLKEDGLLQMVGKGQGMCCLWPDDFIQQDRYISDGTERFWEPKFSYKGYRYIQVEGYEGELTAEDVELYCLGNDVPRTSEFHCSNEQIQALHDSMCRAIRNNLLWKPTDTPVWEKNGWLGDVNVALPTMFYQYDMGPMMKHFWDIMDDCFTEYGLIPCMVPTADWEVEKNQPVWNTLFVHTVEYLYDYYGDLEMVRGRYPRLKKYALQCIEESKSYGWTWSDTQLSDWHAPTGGPENAPRGECSEGSGITGTVCVYKMLQSMMRLARLAGEEEDIACYQDAYEQIAEAFQKKYYRPEEKMYDTGCFTVYGERSLYRQTSNLLPLEAGLVPSELREDVVGRLVNDVLVKDYHPDTGCVGTRLLLPVLADNGYKDLAWKLLMQDTYPSWGFWLKNGGDCPWEGWELGVRSRDHFFLGTCAEFFYSHLCGIRKVRDGCKHVTIAPVFYPELESVGAKLQTIRGELECSWKWEIDGQGKCDGNGCENKKVILQLRVPNGTEAQIYLPTCKIEVLEGCEGLRDDEGVLQAVSGTYLFCLRFL